MVKIHAFGYNGFKQLNITDDTAIVYSILNSHYNENPPAESTNEILLSCSWESVMFFQGKNLIIQGYCGCLNHRLHYFNMNKAESYFKEKIKWLGNAGNCFGILTETRKFLLFNLVCKHELSTVFGCAAGRVELVKLYELNQNCSFAVYDSVNFFLHHENGKILTIKRDLKSLQFYIASEIAFKQTVSQLECGNNHCLALTAEGKVYSWGIGSRGQLGHGNLASCDQAQLVEALDGISIKKVAAGGWHSVALAETNDLYSWGWNESGQTGFPAPHLTFSSSTKVQPKKTDHDKQYAATKLEGNSNVIQTYDVTSSTSKASEKFSFCEIDYEPVGVIMSPMLLELERHLLVKDSGFISVIDVAAGSRHTAAIVSSGQALTWGWGKYGQLGQKCCTQHKDEKIRVLCRDCPHSPGLMQLSVGFVANQILCGPWSTFVFGAA